MFFVTTTTTTHQCGTCRETYPSYARYLSADPCHRAATDATLDRVINFGRNWANPVGQNVDRPTRTSTGGASHSRTTFYPATEAQLRFLRSLGVEPVAGLSKSEASKQIDAALADRKSQPKPARPVQAAQPVADVPAGHYAIESTGHNDLAFYRVDRPTSGNYAGRTFVKLVVGGHPDQNVAYRNVAGILARIAEAGIAEAAQRYGVEIGRCSRCNRHLTDQTSRALGIGPECRSK